MSRHSRAASELGGEWHEHTDKTTGKVYYESSVTGRTTWEKPQTMRRTESMPFYHYKDLEGKIQGPYPMAQMAQWYDDGYFPEKTSVRLDGTSRWRAAAKVFGDIDMDTDSDDDDEEAEEELDETLRAAREIGEKITRCQAQLNGAYRMAIIASNTTETTISKEGIPKKQPQGKSGAWRERYSSSATLS